MTDHERGIEAAKKAFYRNMDPGLGVEEAISAYLTAYEHSKPVAEAVKVKPEPVGYVTKNELTKLSLGASCVDLFGKVVPKGFEMVPLYAHPHPRKGDEDGK